MQIMQRYAYAAGERSCSAGGGIIHRGLGMGGRGELFGVMGKSRVPGECCGVGSCARAASGRGAELFTKMREYLGSW